MGRTFRVAMVNEVQVGAYERPDQAEDVGQEWLIVERRGAEGEVLLVSDGSHTVMTEEAPAELSARNTIVAVLAEAGATPRFLIVRHPPAGLDVPGSFFPADGFVELRGEAPALQLRAVGRHAHRDVASGGVIARRDVPDPTAEEPDDTANWHFTAAQRRWAQPS